MKTSSRVPSYLPHTNSLSPLREQLPQGCPWRQIAVNTERNESHFMGSGLYIQGNFNLSQEESLLEMNRLPKINFTRIFTHRHKLANLSLNRLAPLGAVQQLTKIGNYRKQKIKSLSATKDNPEFVNWKYRPCLQEGRIVGHVGEECHIIAKLKCKSKAEMQSTNIRGKVKQLHLKKVLQIV